MHFLCFGTNQVLIAISRTSQNATHFNQPLDSFTFTAGSLDLSTMFWDADEFNQSLCSWGSLLDASSTTQDMFLSANICPSNCDPDLTVAPPGPFCYCCNGVGCPDCKPTRSPDFDTDGNYTRFDNATTIDDEEPDTGIGGNSTETSEPTELPDLDTPFPDEGEPTSSPVDGGDSDTTSGDGTDNASESAAYNLVIGQTMAILIISLSAVL